MPATERLAALSVQLIADVTQPIAPVAGTALILWDVATQRAYTVVVVETICGRPSCLVNRMKRWRSWQDSPFDCCGYRGLQHHADELRILYKANTQ